MFPLKKPVILRRIIGKSVWAARGGGNGRIRPDPKGVNRQLPNIKPFGISLSGKPLLALGFGQFSALFDRVSFYAVPPGDPAVIVARIGAFAPSLPKGVRFTFASSGEHNAFCADAQARP